jgi:hypothetical protein
MRKAIFAMCALFALLAEPLAAQSSIGGLGSDIDIFMLPNWANLVSYNDIYSFLQGTYGGGQGVSIGFGKKIGANDGRLHFYFASSGFTLSDYTRDTESAADSLEGVPTGYGAENGAGLTMQFDSLYYNSKFGGLKLGLNASGIRVDEDLNETAPDEYTEQKITAGTFTPSLEYGRNFIHADGSMWTVSLGSSVAIPFSETVTETKTAGITTTTTDTSSKYMTWALWPTFCYVFKPITAPVYTIWSIYLSDTFSMRFYPDYLTETEISGVSGGGWTERSHSYINNLFFSYVDSQNYITPALLIRWRLQLGLISTFEEQGNTKTKDAATGTETERKESVESYVMQPYLGGWIGFTWQAIPSFLSIIGAVAIPVGTNATYWYFLHSETTDDDNDSVTTADYSGFAGFYTQFSLGATMMLNSNLTFELGTVMDASSQRTGLDSVALTLKYKK